MSETGEVSWEVEITHDGWWPFKWSWTVERRIGYDVKWRRGDALTKDRARRKALAAKRSMQEDDVTVVYP